MDNLFDVVNNKIFSVFGGKDKRANYDLISTIYDFFTKDERRQTIEKDELTDMLAAYIKEHDFDELDDDEGMDINYKPAREKAAMKLRQFKKCGWIEEDNSEGFDVIVSLTDNAISLLETFKSMVSMHDKPIEYTGYFLSTYSMLVNIDYSQSKALIEQIVKNTTALFNSLQGLHSEIKLYIRKLINQKDLTPNDVLDLLLNKYQNQIMLIVFNNLKGKDTPSKYTSDILDKLNDMLYNNLDRIVRSYAVTVNISELTSEKYEEIEKQVSDDLKMVINRYESVDEFISAIDDKNRKFHNSALATLNFLMNNRNDINGQIDKALRVLSSVEAEDFSNIIGICSSRNIDENSLHTRAFNKTKKTEIIANIPEISEEEVAASFDLIFGEDEFSKDKINSFILNIFGDKEKITLTDIPVKSQDDFFRLILIQIYSAYDEMKYDIEFKQDIQNVFGYSMQSFELTRR